MGRRMDWYTQTVSTAPVMNRIITLVTSISKIMDLASGTISITLVTR